MPISISGSGTITGISAGGLPDGCVTGDDIANSTIPTAKLGTTEQSRLCRAWVNFDGTGTVAIRASYNVSSITDNGGGQYTVNFTTALADTNYCWTGAGDGPAGYGPPIFGRNGANGSIKTTTGLGVRIMGYNGAGVTSADICVAIFR